MVTKGEVLAFLGLLNGMIGGTILVLPLLGIQTGYILIPCVSLLFGSMSFYTCYLIVLHLGECRSLKDVILEHFDNRFSALVIYNLIIALSILGVLINYFQLIIKQIQGFLPQSEWIGIGVFVLLTFLTILMMYLSFGQRLLAIGILSIVAYISFLVWAYSTAQYYPKRLPPTGSRFIDLGAALMMGYSVHDFVIQVLYKTTTNDKFKGVISAVYIAGTVIYTFISYAGYTIINRQPRVPEPETISEYFPMNSWQVRVIQILYLFHLLTVSPQFCIIFKTRMLQICKVNDQDVNEGGKKNLSMLQLAIFIGVFGICYILYRTKVKLSTIIEINGSVIGFFYIFLIPIVIHLKCVYFSKHDHKGVLLTKNMTQNQPQFVEGKCKCRIIYKNTITKVLQLMLQAIILGIGLYTVYYTLYLIFNGTPKHLQTKQLDKINSINNVKSHEAISTLFKNHLYQN